MSSDDELQTRPHHGRRGKHIQPGIWRTGGEEIPAAGTIRDRFKRRSSDLGFVYFIEAREVECVKIGFARHDPVRRLAMLEVGCPCRLDLVAVSEGIQPKEDAIQHHLWRFRVRGEWFFVSPDVREAIDAAVAAMRPENRPWCLGGEKYDRWQARRRMDLPTIEELMSRPLVSRAPSGSYVPETIAEILSYDNGSRPYEPAFTGPIKPLRTDAEWMVPKGVYRKVKEKDATAGLAKPTPSLRPKPKPAPPKRVSGHFALIDEYRAARKAANP